MSLSVIPLTILGQITGLTDSGDTVLYQVSFKSIDGTPLYGVTAVWTDEQAEIEALAAQKPYGVWINPIDGTFTVKFAGYTYVGSADLTDSDVLAGITPIEFTTAEVSDRLLPEVDSEDAGKTVVVNEDGDWELGSIPEELPDQTGASEGDVLAIGSSGLEWAAPSGGGGTTIFEADLENEVPVSFDNYESNSALMYDIYINGALCKRLQYSVLSGTPNYSTYDTTGELYVELTASTGEITLYANEGDTCHIKIVKKSRPESIMVFAKKSGDVIHVDAAFGDILTAAKEGYTFQLAIDGEISGSSRYSEIGTLQASIDTSNYTAVFASTVTWRGESITWTVNLTNMSISGTVGGINA